MSNYQLCGSVGAPTVTLTNEYVVLNGFHYAIVNGYTYKRNDAVSIRTKDIISVEKKTIRSKRCFVACLVLFGLIPIVFAIVNFISSTKGTISTAINTYENIQYWSFGIANGDTDAILDFASVVGESVVNGIIEDNQTLSDISSAVSAAAEVASKGNDVYQASQGSLSPIMNWVGGALPVATYILLFCGSAIFLVMYAVKSVKVVEINARGYSAAFEVKWYTKAETSEFITRCINVAL